MDRPPGRHGLRRDGGPAADPRCLSEGQVPDPVRPARRLVEHRRQRLHRDHLQHPQQDLGGRAGLDGGLPAAGPGPGRRGLRPLRVVHHDGLHERHRRARVHAGSVHRGVHPEPSQHADPRSAQEGLLGERGLLPPVVSGPAEAGQQHEDGRRVRIPLHRLVRGRRPSDVAPGRDLHVPGRAGEAPGQASPDVRGRAHGDDHGAGRREGQRRAAGASSTSSPTTCISACPSTWAHRSSSSSPSGCWRRTARRAIGKGIGPLLRFRPRRPRRSASGGPPGARHRRRRARSPRGPRPRARAR